MGKKAAKMYKDSPKMERSEETGKMDVKKKPAHKDDVKSGTEGEVREGVPVHARHAMDRMALHHKHETEHYAHDQGDHGDKKEMHGRHEKEMADMHKRHHKEGDGEKMISKVESDKKEEKKE